MSTTKSVAIFGAGISGLSAAHELAEKGLDVSVYECLSVSGGVARSEREKNTNHLSEYSWRGYGPWYHNVFNLMRRIPTSKGTVYCNLSKPVHFYFPHNKDIGFKSFTRGDYFRLVLEIAKNATACEKRIAEYSKINAAKYLKTRMTASG